MTLPPIEGPPYYQLPSSPPPPPRRSYRGLAIGLSVGAAALVIVLVVIAALAYVNRQYISDQFAVWNYTSTPTIDEYAARSTMTDHGVFLFKASRPKVTASAAFNDTCGTHEEGAGILGCYLPSSRSILLFDVTDARLDGIEEVVASHEMLHAAWDRMSSSERSDLARLLEVEATRLEKDSAFSDRMDFYAKAEPGERANELHSIIGTEVSGISPALESHYAEYFSDREALVALHVQSDAVFVANEKQAKKLSSQMEALRKRVDRDDSDYRKGYKKLSSDIDSFNTRATNGSFTTQAQFNSERGALLDRQDSLDSLWERIQTRIDRYNDKRDQLKELNAEADELNESINITPYSETPVG